MCLPYVLMWIKYCFKTAILGYACDLQAYWSHSEHKLTD
jgi:hypothetical protein